MTSASEFSHLHDTRLRLLLGLVAGSWVSHGYHWPTEVPGGVIAVDTWRNVRVAPAERSQ